MKLEVEKSVLIHKDPRSVFNFLVDFHSWSLWSPWLILDESAKSEMSGKAGEIGSRMEWSGDVIGAGEMTLAATQGISRIDIDLTFLRPFRSKSKVAFLLTEKGDQTEVRWLMNGSLPFFLFFMRKFMQVMIGQDYVRGLMMLKSQLETGHVPSKVHVAGIQQRAGFYYVGIEREVAIAEMGRHVQRDFSLLGGLLQEGRIPPPHEMITFTLKHDFVTGRTHYIAALVYPEAVKAPASDVKVGHFPEHKCLCVEHTGHYEFLGNAWTSAMSYQRVKKLKARKELWPYDVYVNTPLTAKPEELLTRIIVPLN